MALKAVKCLIKRIKLWFNAKVTYLATLAPAAVFTTHTISCFAILTWNERLILSLPFLVWRWHKVGNPLVCGASALRCGQGTLLNLSLVHWPLRQVNCHRTSTNPPERLQHVEHPVPHVLLRVVPLHNVNHAPAVPGIPSHHVDLPVKHCHTNIALTTWHRRHHRPLVRLWAVVFAAQDVVVVAAASEVIPAHDVELVAHSAHAVKAAELHHVGSSTPCVSDWVVTPQLLLERVSGDAAWVTKGNPTNITVCYNWADGKCLPVCVRCKVFPVVDL